MNDQLQKALADLLSKANQGIDTGVSFLQAQLPDVVQQLLVWKMAYSMLSCVAGMALLAGAIYAGWRGVKAFRESEEEWINHPEIVFLIVPVGLILLVVASLIDLAWLQILIAPKIYLLEYAAHLAK